VLVCSAMIIALDRTTQLTALGWMAIGLTVYFIYGKSHSKLAPGNVRGVANAAD